MPRRRSTKRQASSKKFRPFDRKIKGHTSSDIILDEEEEFHLSRDEVLLNGEDGRSGLEDEYEDEVFALNGMVDSDDQDGVEVGEEEEAEAEEEEPVTKKKKVKAGKKTRNPVKVKENAVLSSSSSSEGSDDERETWGTGKGAYYASNAAELDSDNEEGHELEEQEARRLQAKMREELTDADFGLEDIPDVSDLINEEPSTSNDQSTPPSSDKQTLIRFLEKTSPETLALARDWGTTAQKLAETRQKIETLQPESLDALSLGLTHLHYQALLSYTTTLAFYLHLRASKKYAQRPETLTSHPILKRLLTLKSALATLEEHLLFDFATEEDGDEVDEEKLLNELSEDDQRLWLSGQLEGLEPDELADLLRDLEREPVTKTERPPKKKRKTAKDHTRPKAPLLNFDLEEPDFQLSKQPSSSRTYAIDPDSFGEVTHLQRSDAADKMARKKTLRFHTSRIESASARRQHARAQAAGGDDDLPYRERKKDKAARLAKEAKKRVQQQGGEDLEELSSQLSELNPGKRRRDEEESGDDVDPEGPDGYYELVKTEVKKKKEKKKLEYEAAQKSSGSVLDESTTGPRSLTRAILANKGLTPHRPKSVRNPRVKKRLRFEKAKRKVSSQKAVYKGGLSKTGYYEGEKSGISKVVKSVRLG